jgi:Rap1a immunity proteins
MTLPARALLVAVFILSASAPAPAQTAGEMLHACQTLQRGIRIKGHEAFLPSGAEAQQCWGFMSAVQEYSVLADQGGNRLLSACPAPDTKTTQIVDVFVKYANAHPDKSDTSAAVATYNAMADAFPCPQGADTPPASR